MGKGTFQPRWQQQSGSRVDFRRNLFQRAAPTGGPPRRAGLSHPHRPGQQPAVHRAHPRRHRKRRAPGQPGHLRHAGKQAGLGPGSIDTILAGGEPKELVVELRRHSASRMSRTPPKPSPAPPPRSAAGTPTPRHPPPRRRRDSWYDSGSLDPQGNWPEEGEQTWFDRWPFWSGR